MTENLPAKKESTYSERFTSMIVKEFGGAAGEIVAFTPKQKRLAQHLFIHIDTQLKALETKRLDKNPKFGLPMVWSNINMNKLALDAVHRIELGLDALVPNHISPIPYFNKREQKYDLDLRIGFVGKDCYRRAVAMYPIVDITYELVYSEDKFVPKKRSMANDIESYEFEITSPFSRGKIIGGFGYIMYEDARKNKLVIVTEQEFERSHKKAKGETFWANNPVEMRFKTLVHRVADKITIDPDKVSDAYAAVESQDHADVIQGEIDDNANQDVIDITEESSPPEKGSPEAAATPEMTDEEKAEIAAAEMEGSQQDPEATGTDDDIPY